MKHETYGKWRSARSSPEWLAFILGGMLFSSSCGGDGREPPTVDVTGSWAGTWLSGTGMGGDVTAVLTQTGADVDGTMTITDSPCFSVGNVSGTVSGNRVSTGAMFSGDIRVNFEGTVVGDEISGTYDAVRAGACTGDTGTFSLSR
jgi:hypothetical protein